MDFSTKAKVLLHPARARIYTLLCESARTVREINVALPDIPPASAYRHLAKLREVGLVERRPGGEEASREVRYVAGPPEPLLDAEQRERITPEQLVDMVHALTEVLRAQFGRFAETYPFPLADGDVSCMVRTVRLTPDEMEELRNLTRTLVERSDGRTGDGWEIRTLGFFSVGQSDGVAEK